MTGPPLYTAWPVSPTAIDRSMHIGSLGHLRRQSRRTYARFDCIAVGLIVRGGGSYRIVGRPVTNVSAGTVISVYPGATFDYGPHDWWEEYYIGFTGQSAATLLSSGLVSTGTPLRRVTDLPAKVGAFEEILRFWRRGGPGDADRACLLGRLLLVDLFAGASEIPAYTDPIDGVLHHCRQHSAEAIDFKSLADRYDMSYSRLRGLVRGRTGLPPAKFLTRLRCEAASVLLATTRLPVKDVAARVGIGDPYTFSRTYRRTTGQSPDTYRRRQRIYPANDQGPSPPSESSQD